MKNLMRVALPLNSASKDFLSKFMRALPEDAELLSAQRIGDARGPLELRLVSANFPEDRIATEAVVGISRERDGNYELVVDGRVLITFPL